MTAWTDEEIIAKIREYAEAKQPPPPAPVEAVAELEAAVGHPMPPLLRRLYCEVANGGFGADEVVSLTDNGKWFSDEKSLIKIQQLWSMPDEQLDLYPNHVLPLATMGRAIWWHVDFSTPEGRMWGWDPNSTCERHRLLPREVHACRVARRLALSVSAALTAALPRTPDRPIGTSDAHHQVAAARPRVGDARPGSQHPSHGHPSEQTQGREGLGDREIREAHEHERRSCRIGTPPSAGRS